MPDAPEQDQDPRGPFVVDPERARDRGRSGVRLAALGLVAVVVVGLTGWGLLTPPQPSPPPVPPTPRPSTALGSGPPASGTPEPASPGREDDAVLAQLARRAGWADCPIWRGFGGAAEVAAGLVDAARSAQGVDAGRLEVDDLQGGTAMVWLGDDALAAVRAFDGTFTVRAGDFVWTATATGSEPPVAIRLDATTLEDGTVYWQERARALPAPYCVEDAAGPPARVLEVGAGADALRRLFVEMGIDVCRTWQRMGTATDGMDRDIDQAMNLLGIPAGRSGWATVPVQPGYGAPQVRTWVGSDPAEAGAQHGSDLVVLQPGDQGAKDPAGIAWMAVRLDGRPAAIQLRVVQTQAGRTAWIPTPNAAGIVGSCSFEGVGDAGSQGDGEPGVEPGPTVELVRGGTDALPMIVEHFGWNGCRISSSAIDPALPALDLVDQAARAAGGGEGWIDVDMAGVDGPVRAWLGDDLVALARANDVVVAVADGTSTVWLADPSRATAWRASVTPEGRTAWFGPGSVVAPDAPCAGTAAAPDTIDGIRSFTCWTDRARCLEAVHTAIGAAPDAFTPGTEVAAGLGEWCEPSMRCAWIGPNMPIVVTAAPAGWASSADIRVFSAGWRRASMSFQEVPADDAGPRVLAMASRPSLALPVAPDGDPGTVYCPASGITGEVRGSAWDPRVAWIGLSSVRWPEGFTARFTPSLEVVSPDGAVYRDGDRVQASGLVGGIPEFEACRITGTSAP